ncbi:MAG: zinc-ribbon domain-containing protein [Gammaproteobacteria bacterium]|nr:zinc-ribbon domain-containing protein [Gammaproteobacteria bacterium]MBT8111848.1 zinc-ribbon domain-containing protein [Gammaproteobacteria bacterium]NND48504.1 DUF3426 domain-containing protein [Woeseiaceae bacterium]NNL46547.1 DUF3426 domain-containing protein [Woeseiaceae bacterium]
MYTQCPECSTAFRVTAEVLKQASGKVRCGGCGKPFNALEYLSEGMPEQAAAKESEAPLPELTPEPLPTNGEVPRSISAEQSAALLKTLDQLAGSDIRIEDTGVEWRVLDEDDAPDSVVDEVLDKSPTPVDQFLTKTPTDVEAAEIFEESANALAQTPVDELRFDDNTPLPDDFDLDDESSYLPETGDAVPEARTETGQEAESRDETEGSRVDVMLGEPDEWADILGEVDEPAEAVAEDDAVAPPDAVTAPAETEQEILDVDTQFALQAEAMGIDLSGMHPAPEIAPEEAAADVDEESFGVVHEATADVAGEEPEIELDAESEKEPVEDLQPEPEPELESSATRRYPMDDEDDEEEQQAPLEFGSVDTAIAQLEEQSDVFDKNFFEGDEGLELQDDASPDAGIDDEELDAPESEDSSHAVPAQTEEEQTLNMMIDQDLLSFAVEDEDGFASTIVIPEKDAEDKAFAEKEAAGRDDDISTGFETIVMEGESIRSAPDAEKREADIAAAAALARQARDAANEESTPTRVGRRRGMTAAIVLLALLLIVQVMHQSRDALATIPAFNNVVGVVYRAVGRPLSPAWDVRGWRFEATQEVIDENDDQLTIYSRVGNNSDSSLPYPLVNVALIDRFEETVGNRTLDPAEYLTDDLDPGKHVPPGNTFNAVISIQSPAPDATGYKLKVCYRQTAGQLRCSSPGFK